MGAYIWKIFYIPLILTGFFTCCISMDNKIRLNSENSKESQLALDNVVRVISVEKNGSKNFILTGKDRFCSNGTLIIEIQISGGDQIFEVTPDYFREYVFVKIEGVNDNEDFIPPSCYYGKSAILKKEEKARFSLNILNGIEFPVHLDSGWYSMKLNFSPTLGQSEIPIKVYYDPKHNGHRVLEDGLSCGSLK